MGFKLRGVIRCGRCRQPRGIRHTCVARFGARGGKARLQSPVTWECPHCHKPRTLRHTCGNEGDFKARKRKAATARRQEERRRKRREQAGRRRERRRRAASERRERERQRRRQQRKQRPRPRGESHEPGTCGDRDCPKYGCKSYWQGMEDCPGPHDGGG
jgi:hypothetical protein